MTYTTKQLEQMIAAATPGPWRKSPQDGACVTSASGYIGHFAANRNIKADTRLIAAAPTVTAELIAARKRIAELEDALVGIKRAGGARMLSYGDEHSYYYHTAHAVLDATQ